MPKTTKKSPVKKVTRKVVSKATPKTVTPHITQTISGSTALLVLAILSLVLITLASNLL